MGRTHAIDRPTRQQRAGRIVEVERVVIPSIPLVEARERFLTQLRLKTSSLSGKRLTPATADKYRWWLQRFERWLLANELPLDLGELGVDDFELLQSHVLDEMDEGKLQESSAATYVRCIKTLFRDTWDRLDLDASTNPALALRAGSQQAVDFPLFKPEHVKLLLKATLRSRGPNVPEWIAHRDHAMLATFFDLGWRVGECSLATVEHVDFYNSFVVIPRQNAKGRFKSRAVGLNPETARELKSWIERWRPSVPNDYLFVSDNGGRCVSNAVQKMFRRLAIAGGISSDAARVSPHTCRHYFAVQWARQHPGDLAGLQRVMGHASVRTTQIYFERAEDLGAVERQQTMPSNWR